MDAKGSGMFRRLFGWINDPEREARQLNRDAVAILDGVVQGSSAKAAQAVAVGTRAAIDQGERRSRGDPVETQIQIDDFRRANRDARDRHDQIGMSANSLAIVYMRAGMLGQAAQPARDAIEAFLHSWDHSENSGPS